MTLQTITLTLPEATYVELQRTANNRQRTGSNLLEEMAVSASTSLGQIDIETDLLQMSFMPDSALWRAARAMMSPPNRERLEELNYKQQDEGLTEQEKAECDALLKLYRETLLMRAQAAKLLHHRGYDISDPAQFQ